MKSSKKVGKKSVMKSGMKKTMKKVVIKKSGMKKAKRVSIIAKGKHAKSAVFSGRKEKTTSAFRNQTLSRAKRAKSCQRKLQPERRGYMRIVASRNGPKLARKLVKNLV